MGKRHKPPERDKQGHIPDLHRGGDPRNELTLGNPAVPLVGGPLAGQCVHQPPEAIEIELPCPDGCRHTYRRDGGQYVHAGEASPRLKVGDVLAENAALKARLAELEKADA